MTNVVETLTGFRTQAWRSAITRPSNTTQYSAGDAISDNDDSRFVFGGMASDDKSKRVTRPGVGTGVIDTVRVVSSANQDPKLDGELWLFSINPATVADNQAFGPTDAELLNLIGVVALSADDWRVGNGGAGASGNAVIEVRDLNMPFINHNGITYGQLVARNTYTPVSGETFICDLIGRKN